MIGNNELRLNAQTVVQALNEYFRKRHAKDVAMAWKISAIEVERNGSSLEWVVAKTIGVGA